MVRRMHETKAAVEYLADFVREWIKLGPMKQQGRNKKLRSQLSQAWNIVEEGIKLHLAGMDKLAFDPNGTVSRANNDAINNRQVEGYEVATDGYSKLMNVIRVNSYFRMREAEENVSSTGTVVGPTRRHRSSTSTSSSVPTKRTRTAKHKSLTALSTDIEAGLAPPRNGKVYDHAEVVDVLLPLAPSRRAKLVDLWTKYDKKKQKHTGGGRYHCMYTAASSLKNALTRARKGGTIRPFGTLGRTLLVSNEKLAKWVTELTQHGDTFTIDTLRNKMKDEIVRQLKESEQHLPAHERTDYDRMSPPTVSLNAAKRLAARAKAVCGFVGVTTSAIPEPEARRIAKKSFMGAVSMLLLIVHSQYLPADIESEAWHEYEKHLNELDRLVWDYNRQPMMAIPLHCIFNTDDVVIYLFQGEPRKWVWVFHDRTQSGQTHAKHQCSGGSTVFSNGIRVRSGLIV